MKTDPDTELTVDRMAKFIDRHLPEGYRIVIWFDWYGVGVKLRHARTSFELDDADSVEEKFFNAVNETRRQKGQEPVAWGREE